jgi:hypothetical protein
MMVAATKTKYREITKATLVTKEEATDMLKQRMPCAGEQDIVPVIDMLYGKKLALSFPELLESAFANTVVPFS